MTNKYIPQNIKYIENLLEQIYNINISEILSETETDVIIKMSISEETLKDLNECAEKILTIVCDNNINNVAVNVENIIKEMEDIMSVVQEFEKFTNDDIMNIFFDKLVVIEYICGVLTMNKDVVDAGFLDIMLSSLNDLRESLENIFYPIIFKVAFYSKTACIVDDNNVKELQKYPALNEYGNVLKNFCYFDNIGLNAPTFFGVVITTIVVWKMLF